MAFSMDVLLVAYRMTVIAAIAGALALAGDGIDEDTFAIAPVAPIIIVTATWKLVSHLLEQPDGIGRNSRLEVFEVWKPLVVEPRGVHRLLDVHAVIDDTHQDVGDRGDDARAAR